MAGLSTLREQTVDSIVGSAEAAAPTSVGSGRHFLRHLGEMLLAMVVGMIVLGALYRGVLVAAGTSASEVRHSVPELASLVMAFNMTVGMAAWMRHRGHSWERTAEMGGAMFVPAAAAIVLFWCSLVTSDSILPLQHVAMLPAMIAVMLFHRGEYSLPVHSHRAHGAASLAHSPPAGRI
jgi:flagellar biosynthetic protein FliP